MLYLSGLAAILIATSTNAADNISDLNSAIINARTVCSSISAEINDLKKMAGINTAITGIGTVAAGVALRTGLKKSEIDNQLNETKQALHKLSVNDTTIYTDITPEQVNAALAAAKKDDNLQTNTDNTSELEQKSKTLGNIRTGTLAASTATNIAGVILAKKNKANDDLKSKIDNCVAAVKSLSMANMQARLDNSASETEMQKAEQIISACNEWDNVDLEPINKRSAGATISSGLGVSLGLAGTITSASANNSTEKADKKNKVANVLAGGTTAASAAATVFNAAQIKAIKNVAIVADKCMEALKQ